MSLSDVSPALSALLHLSHILPIFLAPHTKVEESFSTQAIHDVLVWGSDAFLASHASIRQDALRRFDHLEFPGAVPRSFLPPAVFAAIAAPVLFALRLAGVVRDSFEAQTVRDSHTAR
ncbi:hypothetical protein IE81DRAFT_323190 [Ceraceosorus guamensis]|uniref:Uncharacterized protein n=1 Tax=Ceraceosorus guamensis TaxID=1522189 RepID=A0A316W1K7_9BASI|nr:hypothetical protein IE81DRAFT_323190 [Ceraceosorus guamensis]PWN42643.1 hypothetical protein IE81DRAFT_323190 [Ceraceosorus guamensis]